MNYFSTAADYGINPGGAGGAAGASLPATSAGASPMDQLMPWHPHSASFWLALVAGATVLGIFGAEVGARVGRGTAKVEVGKV